MGISLTSLAFVQLPLYPNQARRELHSSSQGWRWWPGQRVRSSAFRRRVSFT